MLEVIDLGMEFPGVKALDRVHLQFEPGQVHALLGENGAGKSTLLKILSGVYTDYSGELRLNGQRCQFQSTQDSMAAGIAIIHQELNVFPNLRICENLFLGKEIVRSWGILDTQAMDRIAKDLLAQVGLHVSPQTLVGDLKVSEQQLVEIAKALHSEASVILMDEPTSALSDQEIERLHELVRAWKQAGKTIIYISHKMDELFRIADRYHVLRDGKHVADGHMKDIQTADLIALMVGRKVQIEKRKDRHVQEAEALRVEHFSLRSAGLENISFQAHRGEILGIYGLMGAGRTELLSGIFGLHPQDCSGEIFVSGQRRIIKNPANAIEAGMAFVTEDRKKDGLVMEQDLVFNMALPQTREIAWLKQSAETQVAEDYRRDLRIKSSSIQQACGKLSGGNQQKVILAKWMSTNPAILLLDEPTRGIDIQAKDEIYQWMNQMAAQGTCIVFASSEIPELMALSDRVLVMCQGRIQSELSGPAITEQTLLQEALPKR